MPTRLKAKSILLPIIKSVPSSVIINGRTSKNIGRVTEREQTFVYEVVDSQRRMSGRVGAEFLEVRLLLGLEGWERGERRLGAED